MQTVLKIGGLVFSGGLTLSLFIRLFGLTPFGMLMSLAALALFEGGTGGWAFLLERGREAQRLVAGVCLVITVVLSLFSSGAEIVMATRFGADALEQIDFQFLTLCSIVIALGTNVVGALAFDAMQPEKRRQAQKLGLQGRLADIGYRAQKRVVDEAETEAYSRIEHDSASLAGMLAGRAYDDTRDTIRALSAPAGQKPHVSVVSDVSPYQLPARHTRPEPKTWQVMNPSMAFGGGDSAQRPGRAPFSPLHANGPVAATGMNYRKPEEPEKMEKWEEDAEAPKAQPRPSGSKSHHAPTPNESAHSQTPPPWLKHTL